MEKRQVYVMGISEVDFTNSGTGEIVKGTSVYYFDHTEKTREGYIPSKKFLRDGEDEIIKKHGIGLYNMIITIDLTARGPRLTVKGFEFIKPAELVVKDV